MGAGKSIVSSFLASKLDAVILDGDYIAKEVMENSSEIINELQETFGVVENGRINYVALGSMVFRNTLELAKLNAIVHPPLIVELNKRISVCEKSVILDAALIPLWQERLSLDLALWVTAPTETRISRIMNRNNFSKAEAVSRIEGQSALLQAPHKGGQLWATLYNSGTEEALESVVDKLVKRLEKVI